MLTAIKNIGEWAFEKAIGTEKQISGIVCTIMLDTDKSLYSGADLRDFDFEKHKKGFYLFKQGGSKGNVPAPFCPLTKPKKTFKKIEGWLKQCNDLKKDIAKDDMAFIGKCFKIIYENAKKMLKIG